MRSRFRLISGVVAAMLFFLGLVTVASYPVNSKDGTQKPDPGNGLSAVHIGL
jgi:hypothetical protein